MTLAPAPAVVHRQVIPIYWVCHRLRCTCGRGEPGPVRTRPPRLAVGAGPAARYLRRCRGGAQTGLRRSVRPHQGQAGDGRWPGAGGRLRLDQPSPRAWPCWPPPSWPAPPWPLPATARAHPLPRPAPHERRPAAPLPQSRGAWSDDHPTHYVPRPRAARPRQNLHDRGEATAETKPGAACAVHPAGPAPPKGSYRDPRHGWSRRGVQRYDGGARVQGCR
jgi:hypothetical protein